MEMTLSKLPRFERNESARKATRGSRAPPRCDDGARRRKARCRRLAPRLPERSWRKEGADGLGKVFLKRSKDSSSLSTRMASAMEANSSERSFCRSAHSVVLNAQDFSRSAKKALSSANALEVSS